MRKYIPHILIISVVFLCNFGCVSTQYGSKYVGENKDGKMHGHDLPPLFVPPLKLELEFMFIQIVGA